MGKVCDPLARKSTNRKHPDTPRDVWGEQMTSVQRKRTRVDRPSGAVYVGRLRWQPIRDQQDLPVWVVSGPRLVPT